MRPSLSWTSDSVQQLRIMSVAARQFYSPRRIHIVKIRRDEEVSCMFIMKNRIKTVLCLALCLMAYISAAVSVRCTAQAQEAENVSGAEIKPSELYARSAVIMDAGGDADGEHDEDHDLYPRAGRGRSDGDCNCKRRGCFPAGGKAGDEKRAEIPPERPSVLTDAGVA